MTPDDLRYPVGKFSMPPTVTPAERKAYIEELASAPRNLRQAVHGLNDAQLDTPYREGGWTVRQVVHHLPDSHVNAYIRFKLALTEEKPQIRTYEEALWAALPEAKSAPVELSLLFLETLHARWVAAERALPEESFRRTFRHPVLGDVALDQQLAHYAWHCRHHIAHITSLRKRMNW
ncbi:MAG TPA: putative metal-dependent hydrolase [Bacteroidota bacterium]|nr:putative metal-dependent hydrolase [Bacteroidota bacterium]